MGNKRERPFFMMPGEVWMVVRESINVFDKPFGKKPGGELSNCVSLSVNCTFTVLEANKGCRNNNTITHTEYKILYDGKICYTEFTKPQENAIGYKRVLIKVC